MINILNDYLNFINKYSQPEPTDSINDNVSLNELDDNDFVGSEENQSER